MMMDVFTTIQYLILQRIWSTSWEEEENASYKYCAWREWLHIMHVDTVAVTIATVADDDDDYDYAVRKDGKSSNAVKLDGENNYFL